MPKKAFEFGIMEETGICATTKALVATRFSEKGWWAIFSACYVSSVPVSDKKENSEALFLEVSIALECEDVTYMFVVE